MTHRARPGEGVPMLLGIALVVDDANKGQRLVFRYPALREHAHRSGKPVTSWALQRCAAEFHQLIPEVFARLFRPKAPLCGRPFQVCIDRVRYMSYPVLSASATKETATDDVLLFNIILAMARLPPTAQPSNQPQPQQSSSAVAVAAARRRALMWRRAGEEGERGLPGSRDKVDDGGDVGQQLRHLETVLEHLTKALLHEERRCRYVSKEVGRLLDIREVAHGKEGWGTAEDAQTMLDTMMEESALANDLKEVFHGLKDGEGLDVAINGWIRLSLPGLLPVVRGGGDDKDEDEDELALVNARPERIQPYHTLLLLMDEETILAKLPKDGSQQLALFVQAANPLKTLEEISAATRIGLPQLRLLTAHLVHWGFARAIRTISLRSVYALKATAPTQAHSLQARAFEQRFPSHSFFRVLGSFGAGKTLQVLLEGLSEDGQVERLAQVVWLLQQDFVHNPKLSYLSVGTRNALDHGRMHPTCTIDTK